MDRRRVALLLAVVGLLCLPAPLYLPAAATFDAPPAKSPSVYAAEPIELDNATDRKRLVSDHSDAVTLSVFQVENHSGAEQYRSPNVTREALRAAMPDGSTTVNDPGARADLRPIDAEAPLVGDPLGEIEGYYRLSVADNGSVVRAENVSTRAVADVIAEQAPDYANLSAGEQRTVDRVLRNSTGDDRGYRPYLDAPYTDELPTPIHKDGTLYSIGIYAQVDDFGPGFGAYLAGLALAGFGVVLLLAAGALAAYDRWRG